MRSRHIIATGRAFRLPWPAWKCCSIGSKDGPPLSGNGSYGNRLLLIDENWPRSPAAPWVLLDDANRPLFEVDRNHDTGLPPTAAR